MLGSHSQALPSWPPRDAAEWQTGFKNALLPSCCNQTSGRCHTWALEPLPPLGGAKQEGVSVNVGVHVHDVGTEQVAFLKGSGARGMWTPLLVPPPHLTSSPMTFCLWSLPHPAACGLVGGGESPHPLGPGALLPEEPALGEGSPCKNRASQLGLPSVHVGERDGGGEGVSLSFPQRLCWAISPESYSPNKPPLLCFLNPPRSGHRAS